MGAISSAHRPLSSSMRSRSTSSADIELAELAGGDGGHPRGDALGRVVARLLDRDRVGAGPRQLARRRRSRRTARRSMMWSRRCATWFQTSSKPVVSPKGTRLGIVVRHGKKTLALLALAHERVKRLRQSVHRRAFRDGVARHEPRDRLFAHPPHDFADDVRCGGGAASAGVAARQERHHHLGREFAHRARQFLSTGSSPSDLILFADSTTP